MITLVRWLVAFLFRRFRWVALGALVRALTRQTRERSVDNATDDLVRRLPDSVVKAAEAAPGDLLRHGGRVVATGRQAKQLGNAGRHVGGATKRAAGLTRRFRGGQWRSSVDAIRSEWAGETAQTRNELWADYHRAMGDHEAADEALLDRRSGSSRHHPIPDVPPPVASGRPRRMTGSQRRVIERVQRTYHRARKPWD